MSIGIPGRTGNEKSHFKLWPGALGSFGRLLAACLAFYCGFAAAEVIRITDPAICPVDPGCWEISGVISESDYRAVVRIANNLKGTIPPGDLFFRLNSRGGNVESAIAIGRQLRLMRATAVTWDTAPCYSSCVFILAGAIRRFLGGNIGIHRPYSLSTEKRDYDNVQREHRRIASLAKAYLEEMNVSPALFDAMMRIPSEQIRILLRSELESYGISELDPVAQELADAAFARHYGLSKAEYLRRKAAAVVMCAGEFRRGTISGDLNDHRHCWDRVLRSTQ